MVETEIEYPCKAKCVFVCVHACVLQSAERYGIGERKLLNDIYTMNEHKCNTE